MAERPTHASVTDVACSCDYLQKAADEPRNPIVFDERTNEYHFSYQEPECEGPSTLIIYHCPFCGGVAPASKRDLLFAVISYEERERLFELLRPIRTMTDALSALGQPDRDDAAGEVRSRPEKNGQPPTIEYFRTMVYDRLSSVAEVWIIERPDGEVHCYLQGKYVGGPSA
jgi:hypothetical protein